MSDLQKSIERAFRRESGQVLATLIGWLKDFELAEDVLQEAFIEAIEHWSTTEMPQKPGAWLTQVARRKALDRLRRAKRLVGSAALETLVVDEPALRDPDEIPDERLKLICTCCHPALALEAQVALTLQTLGGVSTAEIAYAFLVPVPTMAQRLVRAKRKIKEASIPYEVPPTQGLAERLDAIHHVLYLIFTEGYGASSGDTLIRQDLCDEAIRLARILTVLLGRSDSAVPMAQYAESLGLLALMLLHHSRRRARLNEQGALVLLAEQDRSRWDKAQITTGKALLEKALLMQHPGPYQIQAAISALHVDATRPEDTDWPQIAALYNVLYRMTGTAVVELNRAVAVGMANGPWKGLQLLEYLVEKGELAAYHPFYLAKADMLRRLGRMAEAHEQYQKALAFCQNQVEREAIVEQLRACGSAPD
jgi:RNA polymerase sigma-70 factor (ECF subfamily)